MAFDLTPNSPHKECIKDSWVGRITVEFLGVEGSNLSVGGHFWRELEQKPLTYDGFSKSHNLEGLLYPFVKLSHVKMFGFFTHHE